MASMRLQSYENPMKWRVVATEFFLLFFPFNPFIVAHRTTRRGIP